MLSVVFFGCRFQGGLPAPTAALLSDAQTAIVSSNPAKPSNSGALLITRHTSLAVKTPSRLFVCLACLAGLLPLDAAEFTTPITLSETDTTYDGQDIVIDGTTVTIDGPHSFNSLLLTNAAVLNHSACTTTNTHRLDLVVAGTITVSTNSKIDVSWKGYPYGVASPAAGGASTGRSGGSYGGLGNVYGGAANAVYGDYADPNDWGSGGGENPWGGSPGGGLVQVEAGTLVLDGQIVTNGGNGGYTQGSGGGIRVRVGTLAGQGQINAHGGTGAGGGYGGGGRVAVYAQDFSGFNTNSILALGWGGGRRGDGTHRQRNAPLSRAIHGAWPSTGVPNERLHGLCGGIAHRRCRHSLQPAHRHGLFLARQAASPEPARADRAHGDR